MSQYTFEDKALALAGIYQASQCVYELATQGKTDSHAFEVMVNSLFNENPDTTLDVYNDDIQNIQKGIETLLIQMDSKVVRTVYDRTPGSNGTDENDTNPGPSAQTRNIEITKYVLSIIILEKKLKELGDPFEKIARVLESAKSNQTHFGEFHENVIATIARAYSENVSQVHPRIMVNGHNTHLQNPNIANKIRSLLLAGIRCAVLWRQVGGSRWSLIWHRKKYMRAAQSLYRPAPSNIEKSNETSFFDNDHEK